MSGCPSRVIACLPDITAAQHEFLNRVEDDELQFDPLSSVDVFGVLGKAFEGLPEKTAELLQRELGEEGVAKLVSLSLRPPQEAKSHDLDGGRAGPGGATNQRGLVCIQNVCTDRGPQSVSNSPKRLTGESRFVEFKPVIRDIPAMASASALRDGKTRWDCVA